MAGWRTARVFVVRQNSPAPTASCTPRLKPECAIRSRTQGIFVETNIVGSWALLELAKDIRPKHLLLASSSSVYGSPAKIPFEESDETSEPASLYAASKKAMEVMAHAYSHLHRIPITVMRLFTVYGPWGRPDMAPSKFVDGHPRPISR